MIDQWIEQEKQKDLYKMREVILKLFERAKLAEIKESERLKDFWKEIDETISRGHKK